MNERRSRYLADRARDHPQRPDRRRRRDGRHRLAHQPITIVRELLDYSTAIFDRDGWNVAQSARIPSHLNSMSYFLREILERVHPGGRVAARRHRHLQRPYCGGQHLPDIVAFKAVFRDGRRIGFVGTLCHHLDVGGSSRRQLRLERDRDLPGRPAHPAGEDRSRRASLNEAVRAIILQNVRQPELLWGDLQSQLASLEIGAGSIERLAAKLGAARFERALTLILDTSEAAMRAVIGRMPDGTYEFEDSLDDDGHSGKPIRIHAKADDPGRRDDRRSVGLQPAGGRTQQRDARLHLFGGVLRADGVR